MHRPDKIDTNRPAVLIQAKLERLPPVRALRQPLDRAVLDERIPARAPVPGSGEAAGDVGAAVRRPARRGRSRGAARAPGSQPGTCRAGSPRPAPRRSEHATPSPAVPRGTVSCDATASASRQRSRQHRNRAVRASNRHPRSVPQQPQDGRRGQDHGRVAEASRRHRHRPNALPGDVPRDCAGGRGERCDLHAELTPAARATAAHERQRSSPRRGRLGDDEGSTAQTTQGS